MPFDKKGGFHLNNQKRDMADKSAGAKSEPRAEAMPKKAEANANAEGESQAHTTLHDHGDGSFHTEGHDGEKAEHPHIGHALMHMAGKHEPMGKHMHIHSHDGGHTTHHVGGDGMVEGPHEHGSPDEMTDHVGATMGDGESDDEPESAGDAWAGHEAKAGIY